MSKYKFEPRYHDEAGFWYCEKMIYMSLPECYGEFEDDAECEVACYKLNEINEYLDFLKENYNINLRLTGVKRD